jgi:hypothetical protein
VPAILLGGITAPPACQCGCCCVDKYPTTINSSFVYKWADGSVSTFGATLTNQIWACPPPTPGGTPCDHCVLTTNPCLWLWAPKRGLGPPLCDYTDGASCGDIFFDMVVLDSAGPPPVYRTIRYYVTQIVLSCAEVTGGGGDPGTCLRSYCGNAYGFIASVFATCNCDSLSGPDPCDPITQPPFVRNYNLALFDYYYGTIAVDHPCDYLNYRCCPSLNLGYWNKLWHPATDPYPTTLAGDWIEATFTGATTCHLAA